MGRKLINLIGTIFNRLTVIKYFNKDKIGRHYWVCKCSCGNDKEVIVFSGNLKNGSTQSCGCLKKEISSKAHKKYNQYDLTGDYGVGITQENFYFYFDKDDYDLIKDYYWGNKKGGYICTNIHNGNSKKPASLLLHRLIMGIQYAPELVIDHINRHPEDNRKENLRICNDSLNGQNKTIQKNNTTGIIGVSFNKRDNEFESYLTINNKKNNLGHSKKLDDAIYIRLKAEKEYFGEFAPQRHLFKQYGIEE
jgi:hypothetical protein